MDLAKRMWLWVLCASDPAFHAAYSLPFRIATTGNSIVRMGMARPRSMAPVALAGSTAPIVTLGPQVWPPSVDLKMDCSNATVPPSQVGSSTEIRSAATYSVPFAGSTTGYAPMYCWNEQVSKSSTALSM